MIRISFILQCHLVEEGHRRKGLGSLKLIIMRRQHVLEGENERQMFLWKIRTMTELYSLAPLAKFRKLAQEADQLPHIIQEFVWSVFDLELEHCYKLD